MFHLKFTMAGMLVAMVLTGTARADIYRYLDEHGVVHFTDAPTTSLYQIYFREGSDVHKIISYYAQRFGIEEALLCAVIKVESDYDPKAVSRKGAVGLMQLIPTTAADLSVSDPLDVNENVRGGCQYLVQMLREFSGDLDLALAAYNAGPNAVRRHGGVPPYEETINYVRKVKEYLRIFRQQQG